MNKCHCGLDPQSPDNKTNYEWKILDNIEYKKAILQKQSSHRTVTFVNLTGG